MILLIYFCIFACLLHIFMSKSSKKMQFRYKRINQLQAHTNFFQVLSWYSPFLEIDQSSKSRFQKCIAWKMLHLKEAFATCTKERINQIAIGKRPCFDSFLFSFGSDLILAFLIKFCLSFNPLFLSFFSVVDQKNITFDSVFVKFSPNIILSFVSVFNQEFWQYYDWFSLSLNFIFFSVMAQKNLNILQYIDLNVFDSILTQFSPFFLSFFGENIL